MWIGHKYHEISFALGYVARILECNSRTVHHIPTVEKFGIAPEIVSDMAMGSLVVDIHSISTLS